MAHSSDFQCYTVALVALYKQIVVVIVIVIVFVVIVVIAIYTKKTSTEPISIYSFFPGGVSIRPGAECSVHPLLAVFCHRHWCVAAQMGRHVVLIDGLGCPLSSTAVGLGKKKSSGVSFPSSKLVKK